MRKNNTLIVFILFIGLSISINAYSQYDIFPNINCAEVSPSGDLSGYTFPFFPMDNYDNLHALVVFCNYPNDQFYLPNTCLLNYWPAGPGHDSADIMPPWAPYIICPDTNNVWNPTITGYFRTCSRGKFWLTGDVFPELYVFKYPVSYYASSDKKIGYAVKELLEYVDNSGYVDWSKYDKFDPYDLDNDNNRREPDGIIDFIFIVFRFNGTGTVDPPSYSGIACLGGRDYQFGQGVSEYVTNDNYRILAGFPGSGCINNMTNPWELGIMTHEFGEHYSYGYGHSEVMGAYNINGGGIASAYDREQIGWNNPNNAITPTTNTMNIELEDYVTANKFIKIQRQSEVLYLENRRRLNYYSSVDNIIWKWNCDDPVRPIQSDSMLLIYSNIGYRTFNIFSAFGKYNWQMCPGDRFKTQWYTSRNNFFFTEAPNRSGLSTFDLHGCVSDLNCNDIACNTGYWGGGGDFNTCFDVGYNDVISPWSNPPLNLANEYDSLTIEIEGRNNSGNLIVNIYFTNILDARPSKPQGLQIGWTECENQIMYPQLTWEHNIEPDMLRSGGPPIDFKRYRIYRAYGEIGQAPGSYTQIAEENFNALINPVYVDYDASVECNSLGIPEVRYDVYYRVMAIDNTDKRSCMSDSVSTQVLKVREGDHSSLPVKPNIPKSYSLSQNYPNPFNPVTNIRYEIPKDVFVTIKVYDILGRELKTLVNENKNAGNYVVSFNGSELSSGIYFYRIKAGDFVQVKRMVLIK